MRTMRQAAPRSSCSVVFGSSIQRRQDDRRSQIRTSTGNWNCARDTRNCPSRVNWSFAPSGSPISGASRIGRAVPGSSALLSTAQSSAGSEPCTAPLLAHSRRSKRRVNPRGATRLEAPGVRREVARHGYVLRRQCNARRPTAGAPLRQVIDVKVGPIELEQHCFSVGRRGDRIMQALWNPAFGRNLTHWDMDRLTLSLGQAYDSVKLHQFPSFAARRIDRQVCTELVRRRFSGLLQICVGLRQVRRIQEDRHRLRQWALWDLQSRRSLDCTGASTQMHCIGRGPAGSMSGCGVRPWIFEAVRRQTLCGAHPMRYSKAGYARHRILAAHLARSRKTRGR